MSPKNVTPTFPAALSPRLSRIATQDRSTSLSELARALLGLMDVPPPALARRLVASAIGVDAASLDDPLDLAPLQLAAIAPAVTPSVFAPSESLRALPLLQAELVVVDLETTGAPSDGSAILEIGAVRVSGGCSFDAFQTLVNPGRPIPLSIQVLTGIRDRMVDAAPRLPEAMQRFSAWLARSPDAAFVAHNAPFDEGFVRRALALCGLPPLARAVLCTRRLARRLVPEATRFGLDALCEQFSIENRARHRALGDAKATAELLLLLLRRAEERAQVRSLGDLLDLHAASVRAARRRSQPAPTGTPIPDPASSTRTDASN